MTSGYLDLPNESRIRSATDQMKETLSPKLFIAYRQRMDGFYVDPPILRGVVPAGKELPVSRLRRDLLANGGNVLP
jgi:hypothetical protein